ncbi:MAG: hypothetical protein JXA99_09580 [Candidatus Lokiarchaeota archaeon]|nr:hypothetical protein [Candidatus Lokiarchaeota archaeon]
MSLDFNKIEKIPKTIRELLSLVHLSSVNINFNSLPRSIIKLRNLRELSLSRMNLENNLDFFKDIGEKRSLNKISLFLKLK